MKPFITISEPETYEIRPGEPDFLIHGKLVTSTRASIAIKKTCPQHITMMIERALHNGYIEPVANGSRRERIIIELTQ